MGSVLAAVVQRATRFIFSFLLGVAKETASSSVSSWERWGSVNYIAIAARGLRLQRCSATPHAAFLTRQCRTAGW